MEHGQPAQLRERLRGPSRPDQGVDPRLLRRQPLLAQARDDIREPLRRQIGQRLAPPQVQGTAQQRHRPVRPVLGERGPPFSHEHGKPVRVQPVPGLCIQRIAAAIGPHSLRSDRPPQPQNVVLYGVPRPPRRILPPQPAHQGVHRDDITGVDQQRCQHRAQLSGAHAHTQTVARDDKRSKDPVLVLCVHSHDSKHSVMRVILYVITLEVGSGPRPGQMGFSGVNDEDGHVHARRDVRGWQQLLERGRGPTATNTYGLTSERNGGAPMVRAPHGSQHGLT